MKIDGKSLAKIMDATVLDRTTTRDDARELVAMSKKYGFGVASLGNACYVPMLVEELKGTQTKVLTACCSWQGSDLTEHKVDYAKTLVRLGAGQMENFVNFSYFKSGMYDEVVADIRAIREAIGPDMCYKVLLETPLWNDDEIRTLCDLCIDGGADFVKTGTGTIGPATVHMIDVMLKAVRGRIKVKASGGIRTLEMVDQMLDMGVACFGVGLGSGVRLVEEANDR